MSSLTKMDIALEILNTRTLFSFFLICLLLGMFIVYWLIPWLRSIIYMRKMPGYEFNAVLFYYTAMSYVHKNKLVPFTTYMLELICATCFAFQKQRIANIWVMFRPIVLLFKPETVEAVLSSNVIIEKSNEYQFLHPWLGTGLLTSGGDKWRNRRKLLTPAFHFRILEDFLPIFNEQSEVLVAQLKTVCHKEWIDIIPSITMCTLDIICESTMGVHINAQGCPESDYIKAIYEIGDQVLYRFARPWLWVKELYLLSPSGWRFKKNLSTVHGFTKKVIKQKKEALLKRKEESPNQEIQDPAWDGITTRKKRAFLELLLELHINDKSLTEEDIREEVDTFMFEGHDTTAMAISWTLYNVGLCPDVQDKIFKEIDEIFGDDKERPVSTDDLKAMKYLECVIKETLRLYPSVPAIGREVKQDIKINGYTISPGTLCMIIPYMLHRDPETYINPEVFDPDRFLPENSVGRSAYAYVPFSAGPRNCIGQRFAVMEEKTVLANIFRNFKIKSLDPRDRMLLVFELILRSNGPLRLQLTPR